MRNAIVWPSWTVYELRKTEKYTAQAGIYYKPDSLGCIVPTNDAGKELENLHIRGALNTCSYQNWALSNRTDQKEEGTPKHWCCVELGVHVFASFVVCARVSFPSLEAGIGKSTVACRFPAHLPAADCALVSTVPQLANQKSGPT